jgi:hypothetical protein
MITTTTRGVNPPPQSFGNVLLVYGKVPHVHGLGYFPNRTSGKQGADFDMMGIPPIISPLGPSPPSVRKYEAFSKTNFI